MKPNGQPARILVVGDIIADRDIDYHSIKLSPEGYPVAEKSGESFRLGGAGAVALMAVGLGAEVYLSGVVGIGCSNREDDLSNLLFGNDPHLHTGGVLCRRNVKQTMKRRTFLDGRQIFREDSERTLPLDPSIEDDLVRAWPGPHLIDCVLVADYGKGVVTDQLMGRLVNFYHNRIGGQSTSIIVDPTCGSPASRYVGVDCICPNNIEWSNRDYVCEMFSRIVHKMDRDGIRFFDRENTAVRWQQFSSEVEESDLVDTCGAGDMVLAALGVFRAESRPWLECVRLANRAAGLKCRQRGATPVERERVMGEGIGGMMIGPATGREPLLLTSAEREPLSC